MGFPRNRSYDVDLAVRVGLNEALFLGQLDFWLGSKYGEEEDGTRWIHNTVDQWHQQFPFWSKRTVESVIARCERKGYVLVSRRGKSKYDRTKWYSIDYSCEELIPQHLRVPSGQTCGIDTAEPAESSLQENNKKTQEPPPASGNGGDPEMKTEDVELPGEFNLESELDKLAGRVDHGPSMAAFWQACLAGYGHTLKTQGTLNPAKWTKLKSIMAFIDGPERLAGVLEHWSLFKGFAQQQYDMKLPVKPTIEKVHMAKEAIMEFSPPEAVEVDKSEFMTVDDML